MWGLAGLLPCWLALGCGDHPGAVGSPDGSPGSDGGPGSDGAAAPLLWCDDHNPCTDDRAVDGACQFVPAEDGRPCDDGDLCTLGDQCQASACVGGARSSGALAQLGRLDGLASGAIAAVGDRFLAVTGSIGRMHLRLAQPRSDGLEIVAAWDGRLDLVEASDALVDALDGDAVVLGGRQQRSLAMFSLAPSAAPAVARRGDAVLGGQIVSLASRGARIWVCDRDFARGSAVELVDASDVDAPVVVAGLAMPSDCGSVAVSDDGARVYVNTRDGVRFIDASPLDRGGAPTLSEVFAPSAGVSTADGWLVLREPSRVRILGQRDLVESVSVAVAGTLAATLVGGRLLVEGWRTTAQGGMEAFAALYDDIGASPGSAPPVQRDEVVVQRVAFHGDTGPSFRSAVTRDGAALISNLAQRWFALDAGTFDERRAPALAPLGLVSRTAGGVRATGFAASAEISVADPRAPAFAGGGAFGRPAVFEAALDDTTPWPQVWFGDRSDVPSHAGIGRSWESDPLVVDRWVLDGDGRPAPVDSFALPNAGAAQLLAAGGGLYRMRAPVAPGFAIVLQGWPISALRTAQVAGATGATSVAPAFELALSPSPGFAALGGAGRGAFDVDPRSGTAAVATSRSSGADIETAVFWLDLGAAPPRVVEQVRLAVRPNEIRVAGDRAVISTGLELIWLERGRGVVARMAPTQEPFIEHLLGFDGRTAYYSLLDFTGGVFVGLGTARFGDAGPAPALLPLDELAQTMVEADRALVVGMPGQLVTLRPQCDAAQ